MQWLSTLTSPHPSPSQGSIDPTRVTCVKWVPGSENEFLSSHRSGNLYVWTTEHPSKTSAQQNYVVHKEAQDATIYSVKPKNRSPVLFRWSIGHGAITSFAFSPDLTHIAIVSQDGFLRVYDFTKQELYGRMRSYYGALLCVCWSPDGRYVVTGGEDDFINVWSFVHRRVVARGEGHRSYVSAVAFDPYTTVLPESYLAASSRFSVCSSEDGMPPAMMSAQSKISTDHSSITGSPYLGRTQSESGDRSRGAMVAYRLGSVGQDTQLCLWDLSGDTLRLRRPFSRSRSRLSKQASQPQPIAELPHSPSLDRRAPTLAPQQSVTSEEKDGRQEGAEGEKSNGLEANTNHVAHRDAAEGRRSSAQTAQEPAGVQQNSKSAGKGRSSADTKEPSPSTSEQSSEKGNGRREKRPRSRGERRVKLKDPVKKVMRFVGGIGGGGHPYRREVAAFETCNSDDIAPKMHEVNVVEPLIAKKISTERLTTLVFREDCIVTACQEGFVRMWARPGVKLPTETTQQPTASSVPSNPPGVRGIDLCVELCMGNSL